MNKPKALLILSLFLLSSFNLAKANPQTKQAQKKTYQESLAEAAAMREDKLVESIKLPNNQIHKDEVLEIYQQARAVSDKWISNKPLYHNYRLLLVNTSGKEIYVSGDILNRLTKAEAISIINNAVYDRTSLNESMPGGQGLAADLANGKIERNGEALKKQVEKEIVSDEVIQDLKIPANGNLLLQFLMLNKKDEPALAFHYSQGGQAIKSFTKNTDSKIVNELFNDLPGFLKKAYIDNKLSSLPSGIYIVNSKREKGDKGFSEDELNTNSQIQPISIREINEKGIKKTKMKLAGANATRAYQSKNLRIFILQNFRSQPINSVLKLSKTVQSTQNNERYINEKTPFVSSDQKPGVYILYSAKEIKPGLIELYTKYPLSAGEYVIRDTEGGLVYDFAISKPKKDTTQ